MTEKSKKHVESCRFCWMCRHICPIGNATGLERNTARARAFGLSMVNREVFGLDEVVDNVYECAACGACTKECVTGWDPVMFVKDGSGKVLYAKKATVCKSIRSASGGTFSILEKQGCTKRSIYFESAKG